jgi:23S rRNA (adenine2503-C2)-methyltransferase
LNDGNDSDQEEESDHGGLINSQGWTRERLRTMVKAPKMGNGPHHKLAQRFGPVDSLTTLTYISRSKDGTTKLLLTLNDGLQIETVIIPWEDRQRSTLCLSSQVGCRQACVFCNTGRMGLLKSLTSDEILSQVYWANKVCRLEGIFPIDNIVFMGMGEPADNVNHVVRAAQQLIDPHLFAMSAKRVTISTVAPTPQAFMDLAHAPVVLAWSVHASQNAKRTMLVPTTRYTMQELREGFLAALKDRSRSLKSTMLEVTLLHGINDSEEDALHLVEFCQPMIAAVPKLVVNLIPWNNIGASTGLAKDLQQPLRERIDAYQQVLTNHGVLCYIRTTRGDDEGSACGQLATSRKKLQLQVP